MDVNDQDPAVLEQSQQASAAIERPELPELEETKPEPAAEPKQPTLQDVASMADEDLDTTVYQQQWATDVNMIGGAIAQEIQAISRLKVLARTTQIGGVAGPDGRPLHPNQIREELSKACRRLEVLKKARLEVSTGPLAGPSGLDLPEGIQLP